MAFLPVVSAVAGVVGTGMSFLGQMSAGAAARNQSEYQAQVARNNQVVAEQNAEYAVAAGSARAELAGRRAAVNLGRVKAGQAASGIDVNTGSAKDVQVGQREVGALDQLTEENNALLQAYGYRAQGAGYGAEAILKDYAAKSAGPASLLSGAGSLLSGVAKLPAKFSWMTGGGGSDSGASGDIDLLAGGG